MSYDICMYDKLKSFREEMTDMIDVLEDKRIETWIKSLKLLEDSILCSKAPENGESFGNIIKSIKEGLLKDINYRDSFTQVIFFKWEREVSNLYNLPGLWDNGNYTSWEDLRILTHISFFDKKLMLVDSDDNLKGKLIVSSDIDTITNGAFANNTELEQIILPDTIERIELEAFLNCKSLKYLRIPESVKTIKGPIISGCTGLEVLEVPKKFKMETSDKEHEEEFREAFESRYFYNREVEKLKVQIKYY